MGEAAQLRRRQDGGVVGEQLLGGSRPLAGSRSGRVSLCMARSTMAHFLRAHDAVALQRGQPRQHRVQACAEHRVRDPTAAAARTRVAASPGESCSTRIRNWFMVEEQYSSGRWWASASAISR